MGETRPVPSLTRRHPPLGDLAELLRESQSDPARLFEQGLALLVRNLRVDRALLTRVTGLGHEVFWWALGPGGDMGPVFLAPEKGFCGAVLADPERPLVIQDAGLDPLWRLHPGRLELGIQAYVGHALQVHGRPTGTLCVHHGAPRTFSRNERSLVQILAGLMARSLEAEHLKEELRGAQTALELSSAIVEDSALQSSRSGLPNRRFLDIWMRSALPMARRRREPLALALWSQPMQPGTRGKLAMAASLLRGEDLLAEVSKDQYLLVLPQTSESGAKALLGRLQGVLGEHPTGATLWFPTDGDLTLGSALRRASAAFTTACRQERLLVWQLS